MEIIAGVLPGEVVATKGSDVLRAELLKNNLGEGCTCGQQGDAMLNWIVDFSLRHRALVIALALAFAALGAFSLGHLDIDAFPDTTPIQIQINTIAPSLSPEETERQITFPVEQAISGLPGLDVVRSISKFGLSQVVVTFQDGTDIYFARQLVNERLGTVELPEGIERPQMGPVSTGLGEVFHYVLTYEGYDFSKLRAEERISKLTELRTIHDWVPEPVRASPETIGAILVTTAAGERIPLSRLATIASVEGPSTIKREWYQRRVTVTVNVRGRDMGSFVVEAQQKVAQSVQLPAGRYRVEWGGQFEHLQRAQQRLFVVVPVALALIFGLLYMTYRNVIDALRVFTGVPFAWVGGVFSAMVMSLLVLRVLYMVFSGPVGPKTRDIHQADTNSRRVLELVSVSTPEGGTGNGVDASGFNLRGGASGSDGGRMRRQRDEGA